ncbi:transcriptional regulator, partial [Streptomyces inhibens]
MSTRSADSAGGARSTRSAHTARKGPYECGLDAAVDVIGGKWKVLLLWGRGPPPPPGGGLRPSLPEIIDKVGGPHQRGL